MGMKGDGGRISHPGLSVNAQQAQAWTLAAPEGHWDAPAQLQNGVHSRSLGVAQDLAFKKCLGGSLPVGLLISNLAWARRDRLTGFLQAPAPVGGSSTSLSAQDKG